MPLSVLTNKSLAEGVFPIELNIAKIVPVFKSELRLLLNNYRTISLLSNISNIKRNQCLRDDKDFWKKTTVSMIIRFWLNCSINNALLSIIKNIQTQVDNGEFVAGVFVDLKKAFDIVVIMIYSLENLITMMSKGSQRSGLTHTWFIENNL